MYQVLLTRSAEKDLSKLDAAMRQRITAKLRRLASDPRGTDTIKVKSRLIGNL